jgi:hypothetical protein
MAMCARNCSYSDSCSCLRPTSAPHLTLVHKHFINICQQCYGPSCLRSAYVRPETALANSNAIAFRLQKSPANSDVTASSLQTALANSDAIAFSLQTAGLRWRYSNAPPRGSVPFSLYTIGVDPTESSDSSNVSNWYSAVALQWATHCYFFT